MVELPATGDAEHVEARLREALDGIADWAGWHPSPWVSGWLGVFLGVRLGIEAARSLGGKPGM